MKVKCVCGNEFSASLGTVKCSKCRREYRYEDIRRNANYDDDMNMYLLTYLLVSNNVVVDDTPQVESSYEPSSPTTDTSSGSDYSSTSSSSGSSCSSCSSCGGGA